MNKSATEKFIKQIIDGMYKNYGYVIEDFSFVQEIDFPWGLSKSLPDGTKTVLLFIDSSNLSYIENVEETILTRLNCSKDNLVKVILLQENRSNQINEQEQNCIFIDLPQHRIQISNANLENMARQIGSMMDRYSNTNNRMKNAKVTYAIIAINVVIFFITAILSGNFMDIDVNVLVNFGAKYNPLIQQGQWFRLITSTFLHGGLIHIAVNMYSLYSVGPLVESLYGKYKYTFIYLVSGIISSLFSFLFSTGVSIGASGAIFGLVGVLFIFAIKERNRIGRGFLMNIGSVMVINLFIGLSLPGIDNFAHLGGVLAGVCLGAIIPMDKR